MNDKLEIEVMKELDDQLGTKENPFRVYRLEFSYRGEVTLPQDDYNTKITIDTRSEEVTFARLKKDVLFETELFHKHSKLDYAKHITKFVEEHLWNVSSEEMIVTYTGKPFVEGVTKEEIENYRRDVVSGES